MRPELRWIVAVEAHRRRSGAYPRVIHAIGTVRFVDIVSTA